MLKLVCFSLLLVVALVQGKGKVCTDISQCAPGECCQIMSEFMVVSRRELVTSLPAILKPVRSGTCEPYKLEGAGCGVFEKANGYCSCEPGTYCKGEEVPIPSQKTPVRRDMRPSRPGYTWRYQCTKS